MPGHSAGNGRLAREVRLFSRNGVDGRPDFRGLMRAARQRPADETKLSFHAFDLLHLNAADLKLKPLAERRRRLVDRLDEAVPVLYLPDGFTSGDELLAMCAKLRTRGDRLEATGSALRLGSDARLGQGQVRSLERGEPLARRDVREDEMTDDVLKAVADAAGEVFGRGANTCRHRSLGGKTDAGSKIKRQCRQIRRENRCGHARGGRKHYILQRPGKSRLPNRNG